MSDLRNIKRTFCFSRALEKYNKKTCTTLTVSGLYVLYSLYSKRKAATVQELYEHLKRNKHHYNKAFIKTTLERYISEGWAKSEGTYPVRFSLTVEGRNGLQEMERRIRNERSDK